jgi:transposase-like protein
MPNPVLNHPRFHDEQAAYEWVEAIVWEKGRVCPHCGVVDNSVKLAGKSTRIGVYKCRACRKPFTVKINTIFEASHAPMHLWMQAMYLMASSKKGISTNQLARTLGVHLKTAWHMSHRIRLAMDDSASGPLGGEGQILEADETYTVYRKGGPTWILHPEFGWQRRRSGSDRVPVVTLVERQGRLRSRKVDNVTAATLRDVVFSSADKKSHLMTDELRVNVRVGNSTGFGAPISEISDRGGRHHLRGLSRR